ncbi:hypothetical protein SAMN02910447_00946 [Ruminococcus sp. YE71]|uniref:hypothetical protein n=1 Tax=unclassified Ruminococcus TaxID=2608920 RepID=UPI000884CA82|nr:MULTISPECIES: hypothetical protein [unclassified Ruminococcus]SDA15525.1 hypothetical protein SAMN02910446_00945 [Ruminococcus sp. YE78]SFW22711.1 hypothetical protein SAMN02910447_00946 [Ruminococcus sp. YE71]
MTQIKKTALKLSAVLLLITAVLCLTHLTELQMTWYMLTHAEDFAAIERGFDAVKEGSQYRLVYSGGSFEIDAAKIVAADAETTRAMDRITEHFGTDWAYFADGSVFVLAGGLRVGEVGKEKSYYFRLGNGRRQVCSRVHDVG